MAATGRKGNHPAVVVDYVGIRVCSSNRRTASNSFHLAVVHEGRKLVLHHGK